MIDPEVLNRKNNERGATAILIAVALVALIGFGALAVDIGMGLVVRSELQNVSDAAALAGVRRLAEHYVATKGVDIMTSLNGTSPDLASVRAKAQEYAALNKGGGISISVPEEDLLTGKYDPATGATTATNTAVRLVHVAARRDDSANGSVATGLARVLGINEMNVSARSSAALTPLGSLNPFYGDFPIGISRDWFTALGHKCNDGASLNLYPTKTSCAGLHTFTVKPASKPNLEAVVEVIKSKGGWTETTVANKTEFEFIGGTLESVCDTIRKFVEWNHDKGKTLFNVPVYNDACVHDNPNKAIEIIGFVQAEIPSVYCQSDPKDPKKSQLNIVPKCGIVPTTVGSGGGSNDFGLLSMTASMIN